MPIRNLSVCQRLAMACAVPFLAVLVLAGLRISDSVSRSADAGQMRGLAASASAVGQLIHELQKERGSSVGFLTSNGQQLGDAVRATRAEVDKAFNAFKTMLGAIRGQAPDGVIASLDAAARKVEAGMAHRQEIDALKVAPAVVLKEYTAIIASLFAAIEAMANTTSNRELAVAIETYVNIAAAKEFAGQERALVAAGIASGRMTPAQFARAAGLTKAQQVLTERFLDSAGQAQKTFFAQAMAGSVVANVEKARETVIEGAIAGDFKSLTSASWFQLATVRIDAFKQVEDRLTQDLVLKAAAVHSGALHELYTWSGVVLLTVLATLAASCFIGRSITEPLVSLTTDMDRVSRGDLDFQLSDAVHGDEIGKMEGALRKFRDAAIEKKRMEHEAEQMRIRAEEERVRAQQEAIEVERESVCESIGSAVAKLAGKDLTYRIGDNLPQAYAKLRADFNHASSSWASPCSR